METSILDELEGKINLVFARMAEITRTNILLQAEIKDLYRQLAEKEIVIQNLKQTQTVQQPFNNDDQLKRYQETEEKVRNKISEMLAKLDAMKTAGNR